MVGIIDGRHGGSRVIDGRHGGSGVIDSAGGGNGHGWGLVDVAEVFFVYCWHVAGGDEAGRGCESYQGGGEIHLEIADLASDGLVRER